MDKVRPLHAWQRIGASLVGALALLFILAPARVAAELDLNSSALVFLQALLGINAVLLVLAGLSRNQRPGSFLYWAALFGVSFPLLAIAVFDLSVAVPLIWNFSTDRLWVLGFVPLGLLALAFYLDQLAANLGKDHATAPGPDPARDQAPVHWRTVLAGWRRAIWTQVFVVAFTLFAFGLGSFAFEIANLVLYQNAVMSGDRVLAALTGLLTSLGASIGLVAGVLVIVLGAVAVLQSVHAGRGAASEARYRRLLSNAETSWLETAFAQLSEYAEQARYPWWYAWLYYPLGLIAMLILMGVGALLGGAGLYVAGRLLDNVLISEASHVAVFGASFVAPLLGMIVGIALALPLGHLLISLAPRFAEFAYLRAGWLTFDGLRRSKEQLWDGLVRQFRKDRVTAALPLEPRAYVQTAFHEFTSDVYRWGLWACVALFGLGLVDGYRFRILDTDRIIWSDYFDFGVHEASLAQVAAVETACFTTRTDDSVKPVRRYVLVMENGRRFSLHDLLDDQNIELMEAVDARLVAGDTDFRLLARQNGPSFEPDCVRLLRQRRNENSERIIRLLHLPG